MNKFWTDKEDQIIIDNYQTMQLKDIVKKYLPHRTYAATKRQKLRLKITKRQYTSVDENYFNEPNVQNCAIMGFIAADGCVTTNNRLIINLSYKDYDFLCKLANRIGYKGKIYVNEKRRLGEINGHKIDFIGKYCQLYTWETKKWIEDFKKHWNIVPRKTLILEPPNLTKLEHILSFCNGNLDGDGMITFSKNPEYKIPFCLHLQFMGTEKLMVWIKENFDKLTPTNKKAKVYKSKYANVHYYLVTGIRAYIIIKMMLSLDILRLDRKWNLAREYIGLIENNNNLSVEMLCKLNRMITPEIRQFIENNGSKIPDFQTLYWNKRIEINHGKLPEKIEKQKNSQLNLISFPNPPIINVVEKENL